MAKKNKGKAKTTTSVLLPSAPEVTSDHDDLMDNLLAQLDSRDENPKEETAIAFSEAHLDKQPGISEPKSKQSTRSRFQARLARKAAALAHYTSPTDPEAQARLEKEARSESEAINQICNQYNRQLFQINPDGHCLYSAVADQLMLLGKLSDSRTTYVTIRAAAADYIESHPDDFLPFLPVFEDETTVTTNPGLMSAQQFQQYCSSVRSTAVWGGEPEIQALSRAFNVSIYVVQGGVPSVVVHDPVGVGTGNTISRDGVWLSYHRKLYGLGEHYNSLRPMLMS